MRRRLAAFTAALLAIASCISTPAPSSPAPLATERPQQGGRVVEPTTTDITSMQPILVNDASSTRINDLIYEQMTLLDPKSGTPMARLATFSVSSDGLTYTFEINARANWSDGRPIIAQDYLTTVRLVGKSKQTIRKKALENVEGFTDFAVGRANSISGVTIDTTNAKRWTVRLGKVRCSALVELSLHILPTHVFGKYATDLSKDEIDSAPENTGPTVFSGPFKLKEWRKGDQVTLERNDGYWQGAPNVDAYVLKVVPDATAVAAGLKRGELTFGNIEPKDLADVQATASLKLLKYQSLGYTFVGWNTASPTATALADKRVRQALAYGLDMDAVIKAVAAGEATRHVTHHLPAQWAFPSNAPLEQYQYDRAKAEQLLRDAGWIKASGGLLAKDGKPFTLTIVASTGVAQREAFAQAAVEQYRALGIDARFRTDAFNSLVTKLTTGDSTIEATILTWVLGGDVDPYTIWHSSQIPNSAKAAAGFGFTYFKDAAMDKAIDDARSPANGDCSVATRKKHYETFNKILNEHQPYNFGYVPNILAVSQKALQRFAPTTYSAIYNVHEWWIKS